MTHPSEPSGGDPREDLARHAGIGLQFAATVALFAGLGYWADKSIGTLPWLMILGAGIGFLGAAISLVRHASAMSGAPRRGAAKAPRSHQSTPPHDVPPPPDSRE